MRGLSHGYILIAIGLMAVIGTALKWRIASHPGRLLNRLLGDQMARGIYSAAEVALIVLGAIQIQEI